MLSDTEISDSLALYGAATNAVLCERIRAYVSLLLRWNERISLTTVTDPQEILKFHFGESVFAVPSVPINFGRLADVGSGAGFPGIPLAMLVPELQVTLIESNLKKSAFLSEVIRTLDLPHVSVLRSRMEDLQSNLPPFDFITARAVGAFDDLLAWSASTLTASGKLILWISGQDAAEIARTPGWSWREPIRIPGSRARFLLIGSPSRAE
jgi:16S rRNA (guanine527-N7)-methyltransferase